MSRHVIGDLAQIPRGEGRTFLIEGAPVAVFHTREGSVFATQAHCPHRGGPLADGLTDGATVVCPLHDRIFSLATGEGIGNECALTVYATALEGSSIVIEAPDLASDTIALSWTQAASEAR